jgi:tetratricopeptide (TPR) repeat protein
MAAIAEIMKAVKSAEAANRYSEALHILREGLRQNPGNRELLICQAGVLERVKSYPAALAQYQVVIKQSGGKAPAEVVLGLARTLVATSHYEQAQKLFLELKEKMSGNADVLVGLATCSRHKGALNEAEELVGEAMKKNPGNKPATHELAHIQIANKAFEEAIKTLEKNVLREDLHGDSLDLWMETLKSQKRERYMQDQLEAMAKKYPKKVEFHFAYGVTANRAGEISLARPAFQKADKLHPNNPKILYEMGAGTDGREYRPLPAVDRAGIGTAPGPCGRPAHLRRGP